MAIERIEGIVIDIVKYNDRHNIVSLFTRSRGRISFLSPAGKGKGGAARNARIQPLAVIESDVNLKENKNLQSLGAITLKTIWKDLYFNPVKSAVVMFLTEFLNRYLRESAPEPLVWDFIYDSLTMFDRRRKGNANFHIAFLLQFLHFAGIAPDMTSYEKGDYFDMVGGEPVAEKPLHNTVLYPQETEYLPKLLRMTYRNDRHFRFMPGERRELLRKLLQYYAVHFPGMTNLRSPEILAEVFS